MSYLSYEKAIKQLYSDLLYARIVLKNRAKKIAG